jgi:hypothetical protein
MSDDLPVRLDKLRTLTDLFVPPAQAEQTTLELVVSLPEASGRIRDLAAYLTLMDRFYGRLLAGELHSYSHRRAEQLEYREIRYGSW